MARKGMRVQDAPDFVAGKRKEVAITPENVVSYHLLRTEYDTSVAGGSGAGSVLGDAAYRLPKVITIQAGGRPLHHVNGHTIRRIVQAFYPEEFAQTDPADLSAGGGDTARESLVPIPYFLPYSKTPDEFALPTTRAKPRALVDWGSGPDLVDGEDGVVSLSNVETELIEVPLYGVTLPNGQAPPPDFYGVVSIRHTVKEITQDGTPTVKLDWLEEGQEIRAVIVEGMAKDDANNDEFLHDDRVVEKVGPLQVAGTEEFEQVDAGVIQNRNKVTYQRGSLLTGTYILDAAEDRRTGPGDLWTVAGEKDPTLDLQVAAQTNDTQVVVTTIAVVRGKAREILGQFRRDRNGGGMLAGARGRA